MFLDALEVHITVECDVERNHGVCSASLSSRATRKEPVIEYTVWGLKSDYPASGFGKPFVIRLVQEGSLPKT